MLHWGAGALRSLTCTFSSGSRVRNGGTTQFQQGAHGGYRGGMHVRILSELYAEAFSHPALSGGVVTDADFRTWHADWAKRRDRVTDEVLKESTGSLRGLLPGSALATASQLAWYFDHLIAPDPLSSGAKAETIGQLQSLRAALETGYVLLRSPRAVVASGEDKDNAQKLLGSAELRASLDTEIRCSQFAVKPMGTGFSAELLNLARVGVSNLSIPPHSSVTVEIPMNPVGTSLGVRDFVAAFGEGGEQFIEDLRRSATAGVLGSIRRAHELGAGLIATSDAEEDVLRTALQPSKHAAISSYRLALPFVRGAELNRLIEIREEFPEPFLEFRRQIIELQSRFDGLPAAEAAQQGALAVDHELRPKVSALEGEMQAAAAKHRIVGYGAPIIGTGIFAASLTLLHLTPTTVPLVGTGALAMGIWKALEATSQSAEISRRSRSHPMYFAWLVSGKRVQG